MKKLRAGMRICLERVVLEVAKTENSSDPDGFITFKEHKVRRWWVDHVKGQVVK